MGNLKAGDVLVFKAGDDWIGKSIAWLTDSDVSHAAIMASENIMAEMGTSGIYAGNVEELEGDDAIILRLDPEKDPAPIIRATQRYIDCKTRYDFPALAFLAGMIIYRKIRPTQKFRVITDIILRAACKQLDELIQRIILKNPDKAVVCSQLVYQIYEDCGKEYHIELENGLFQAVNANDAAAFDGAIRLADYAADAPALDMATFSNAAFPDDDELAKELYSALTEQEDAAGLDFAVANLGQLPSQVAFFLEKIEEFLEKSNSNIPIDAMFVAPSDLAYKTKNLKTVARATINRLP